MAFEIKLTTTAGIPTAVIREQVPPKERSRFVPAACGEVWAFCRAAGLPRPGRHVALYLEGGVVEVGVELAERFAGNDRVHGSQLPAGRVVMVTHFGSYGDLGRAHAGIRQWCADHGHPLSGICWEIYGNWEESWNADPSRIRTDVFYPLLDQEA